MDNLEKNSPGLGGAENLSSTSSLSTKEVMC